MTKRNRLFVVLLLSVATAPVALHAQSRQELQMLTDVRLLQEQIQQLRLALGSLTEQTKAAVTQMDGQTDVLRKNHADDRAVLDSLTKSLDALGQKLDVYQQQIGRLEQEIPTLREGQAQQNELLKQILAQLTVTAPTDQAHADTGAPPAAGGPTTPTSPQAAFRSAYNLYLAGQYDLAVSALQEFVQKYPTSADADKAQFTIGVSQFKLAKLEPAVAAFSAVISTSKDSDRTADAYYYRGKCREAQGKRPDAIKDYQQAVTQFPDSPGALQARQQLILLGVK